MKYQVIVEDQAFTVEIIDLHERPIRALVDGEVFEVWPEGPPQPVNGRLSQTVRQVTTPKSSNPEQNRGKHKNGNGELDCIKAPIPGVILSLAVHAGDEIQKGQEVCVLEAMKMKNLIRSPRGGIIAAIHVSPGQTVVQNDPLIDFEPGFLLANEPQ